MYNFLEELKQYFDNTPKEKILSDWSKTEEFDLIGPKINDFLTHTNQCIVRIKLTDDFLKFNYTKITNPENTSGLLLNIYNYGSAKSSIFYC
jgi:hypothetical protein